MAAFQVSPEVVTVQLTLNSGKTLQNVLDAINGNTANPASPLRIILHVGSFAGGGSEKFAVVPEPGQYAVLLTAGLTATLWLKQRRRVS